MVAPSLREAGALFAAAAGTSVTPVIPPSTVANDIMIFGAMCNGSTTFTTPGDGWAVFGTSLEADAGQSTEWYWKRHDGSEPNPTATSSASGSGTVGLYGRIWSFQNCVRTGDPFESVANAGTVSETTPDSSAISTLGVNRLVVCFCLIDNDTAFASGFPPAGWTSCGAGVESTVGGDARYEAIQRTEAAATSVASAVVGTLAASTRWRTLTFALIPGPDVDIAPRRKPQRLTYR